MFALIIGGIDVGDGFGQEEVIVVVGERDDAPVLVARHFLRRRWDGAGVLGREDPSRSNSATDAKANSEMIDISP